MLLVDLTYSLSIAERKGDEQHVQLDVLEGEGQVQVPRYLCRLLPLRRRGGGLIY